MAAGMLEGEQVSPLRRSAPMESSVNSTRCRAAPVLEDEVQVEALRTIQALSLHGRRRAETEARVSQLESEVAKEAAARQRLEKLLEEERAISISAKEQLTSLEHELEGKVAALRVFDEAISQREDEIRRTHDHIQQLMFEQEVRGFRATSASRHDPLLQICLKPPLLLDDPAADQFYDHISVSTTFASTPPRSAELRMVA